MKLLKVLAKVKAILTKNLGLMTFVLKLASSNMSDLPFISHDCLRYGHMTYLMDPNSISFLLGSFHTPHCPLLSLDTAT